MFGRLLRWPALALVLALAGCSLPFVGGPTGQPSGYSSSEAPTDTADDSMPTADPAFLAHFTDPLYSDPADDLAPFGSDEGWDLLYEWADQTDQLSSDTTLQQFLHLNDLDGVDQDLGQPRRAGRIPVPLPGGHIDAATWIISSAFTLLYYTGHIDSAGRELAIRAIDVEIAYFDSPPVLLTMRADLESWTGG